MIEDPVERGRRLADFFAPVSARLWDDLLATGALPSGPAAAAREEWECFLLYACVRGLVAAGGFNRDTAAAIDALHERVLERWMLEDGDPERFAARRSRVAERYAEYGSIGQEGGAAGALTVELRLGAAAARHLTSGAEPPDGLAELVGGIHETLVEGSAEAVRIGDA